MNVWIIAIGEPLPGDGESPRLFRSGLLASALAKRGAEVTWWSNAFDHFHKRHRVPGHATRVLAPRLRLELIWSRGYRRNVSLARIVDHEQLRFAFRRRAARAEPPDAIVSSFPTAGLCLEASRIASRLGIALVVDLRDQWPDLFLDLVPRWLRAPARWLLAPSYRRAHRACTGATALIGVTQPYLEWGLGHARRARGPADAVFPMGYWREPIPKERMARARQRWDEAGIRARDGWFTAVFFGAVGPQSDLDTVIEAVRRLRARSVRVRAVLCGRGDHLERLRAASRDLDAVCLPGWVDAAEIRALMERADVGLTPYRCRDNYTGHIPNKPPEYLSAGLPVVNGLSGLLARRLREGGCGTTYREGDAGELAALLEKLSNDPAELEAQGRRALELYEREFNAERVYGAFADHVLDLARRARGGESSRPRGREDEDVVEAGTDESSQASRPTA